MTVSNQVFAVQDRTGTVTQLTTSEPTPSDINVGDTGNYAGVQPWNGNEVSLAFTVCQVNDNNNIFCITTALPNNAGPGEVMQSGWPPTGTVTWLTGDNATSPNTVGIALIAPANAYITSTYFKAYEASRGNTYGTPTATQINQAIVEASDYIDQWYRFRGIKLLQFMGGADVLDPMLPFIDPWLSPFGFTESSLYVPSTTDQHTEWPRQGVVDYSGDNVYGVPIAVQNATCELTFRSLNGVTLQSDYDPTVVTQGAVYQSFTNEIGPLKQTKAMDARLGLGFFPSFPQVDRILRNAGLLVAAGGHRIIR